MGWSLDLDLSSSSEDDHECQNQEKALNRSPGRSRSPHRPQTTLRLCGSVSGGWDADAPPGAAWWVEAFRRIWLPRRNSLGTQQRIMTVEVYCAGMPPEATILLGAPMRYLN